jgi:hypothetical protein
MKVSTFVTLFHVATALTIVGGCAKPKIETDQNVMREQWRCDRGNKKDTFIDIHLTPVEGKCTAVEKKPEGATGPASACRGKWVRWQVTNFCSETLRVGIAFSPFETNHHESVKPGLPHTKRIEAMVRNRARVTWLDPQSKKCPAHVPTGEVCGEPYKYDVYLRAPRDSDERLSLDPELEIEY